MLASAFLLGALLNYTLGFIALSKGSRHFRSYVFCALSLLAGSWLFFYGLTYLFAPYQINVFARLIVVPTIFLPLVLLLFVRTLEREGAYFSRGELAALLGASLLVLFSVPSDAYLRNITFYNGAIVFKAGVFYLLQGALLLVCLILMIVSLRRALRQASTRQRQQIFALTLGIGISALCGLLFNIILPGLSVPQFNKFGPLSVIAFVLASYFVILRYHFLDIPHLLQRSALYALLYVTLASVLCFGVLGVTQYLQANLRIPVVPVLLVLAFLMVALYEPLKNIFARLTNALFLIDQGDWSLHLSGWTEVTTAAADSGELVEQVVEFLGRQYGIAAVCFYLRRGDASSFYRAYDSSDWGLEAELDAQTDWLRQLRQYGKIVVTEIDQAEAKPFLRPFFSFWARKRIEAVMPLRLNGDWEGIVMLGEKKSQQNYTWDDRRHFEVVGAQLAAALAHLRTRSHLLTQERLAALGVLSAGIAHEIRNPMVSIKTLSQLLPTKYNDPIFRKKFEQIVIPQLNRIEDLVTALLHAGKPRKPSRMLIDANEVLKDVVVLCEPERKNNCCDIQFTAQQPVVIYADRSQMTQVFLNLMRNALQAMGEAGLLRVSARELDADWAEIEFNDTGTGMSAQELEHLFDPFYTTKNEGTGLGLSISYRIIEEHGGKIILDSTPALGTTFTLRLPRSPVVAAQKQPRIFIRPTPQNV